MRNLCNIHCKLLDDIDLFGKEPELYFKGNSKRTSWVGRIFTVFYAMIYVAFFLYKLIRMIQNKDVDFYQTTTFTGETPSIHLTNEVFYGGFALGNPYTLKTFVDESIYYVEAYFMMGHKEGNDWVFVPKPLEVEICKLEKFGEKYREVFKNKDLDNLYCLKEMDVDLEGHTTYDVYSFFQITFYPCVNTTENNNKCKPIEQIEAALNYALITVKIQDIELTPENYNSPTEVRGKELSSPVYKNLYQNIAAYFHIVHVETDIDMIGFELFKNIQTKTFFKYDGTFILPSINNNDIYHNVHDPLCHLSIQLTEQILTLKRTNTKLTEVLGEVGGLMEVVFSLFRIISSFLTDNLYEQALVNNLFSFDIDKKTIKIKNKLKKNKSKSIISDNNLKIYSFQNDIPQNSINVNDNLNIQTNNKFNDNELNKKSERKNLVSRTLKITNRKRKFKSKTSFSSTRAKFENNEEKNKKILEDKEKKENNDNNDDKKDNKNNKNDISMNDLNNINSNENKDKYKVSDRVDNERKIIDKVKISKWCTCCCFLCARKMRNIQNILLDEGMRIIMEKLDILNMFKKMIRDEKIQENYDFKNEEINMSQKCKQNIQSIYNPYYGI